MLNSIYRVLFYFKAPIILLIFVVHAQSIHIVEYKVHGAGFDVNKAGFKLYVHASDYFTLVKTVHYKK